MNKFSLASLLYAIVVATPSFADTENQPVTFADLTQDRVENFFAGKEDGLVIHCPEGTILPLDISLGGEFLSSSEDNPLGTVRLLKSCFVKCVDEVFFFSTDGETWKGFSDFFTGSVAVSISTTEEAPLVGITLELDERK